MEPMVVCVEKRRGRKRKSTEVNNTTVESDGKNRTVETRSIQLVGRYVRKEFEGSGVFLGKIMFYNSGLYRIKYDNGDFEDLNSREVKTFLIEEGTLIGEWFERKKKLDKLLLRKESNHINAKVSKIENMVEQTSMEQVNLQPLDELSNNNTCARDDGNNDVDVDADSSSDAGENTRERVSSTDMEVSLVPPPELPPSSGHIGVLEEYVSHLLSVHSFLRSFSGQLFLYPFGLDDFVGALNCSIVNTLLDSIHVALMRILKRQFEKLSLDGSEIALKCLSFLDWSLLDTLTWPVYLAHYLMVMGYANGSDWKGFYTCCLRGDYYTLSAGKKLVVLQILCDDVLDSEELRAEMDMREKSEVGTDIDTCFMVGPTGGPRRFHPRRFKTSACKDKNPIPSMCEHHEMKPFIGGHFAGFEEGGSVGSSIDEDGNGDECRLCGMDGLLLCCDGCPSAYHARCLGLNKMHMSADSWYCPECKISATEPKILQGTTLRGGRNFGVDPYEQVFIANGDHLLILKTSVKLESSLRYYNRHDIPRVIHALLSKPEHVFMYSEICHEIENYWELPEAIVSCNRVSEVGLQLANDKGSGESTTLSLSLLKKSIPKTTEVENSVSCVTSTNASDLVVASFMDCSDEPARSGNSSDTVSKSGQLGNIDYSAKHYSLPVNGTSLEATSFLPRVDFNRGVNRKADGNSYNGCFYMGSSFKTNPYINHYLHGDFAASAAVSLAILSSEENQGPKSRTSDNRKKVPSASISLQVKAFSSAASRFFWPNTERKLVEVPRERCSWCFSCKASVTSKKGCLLNAAASNATRGAIKVLAGVRSTKNGDRRLLGMSTYIMFIEESLSGLLVGPFLNATFRTCWHRQVEQAATCNALKILLLEIEENIRTIALAGDWTKPVGGSTQSSDSHIAAHTSGSTQKRRPGRHGKKPSASVEVAVDDSNAVLTGFTWWRGNKLSKLVSHRGILPYSIIRKAARHGSWKKIPGIHYVEGNETPKTSRQLIWRSAVEMSRNIAQLALQVRYLDFYMRWSDFGRPEQTPSDGKSSETEATAFRNAFICDKKNLGNKIRYCVAFRNQKHLPSRILKSVTEVEQPRDDGQERYWFCETHIPLYLIKEYEEKVKKDISVDVLSKLQRRRQLKASRKNIFLYLLRKQDSTAPCYCCSCQQNVLYRDSLQCSACQGSCHNQCATSSTVHMNGEVEFLVTCKQCSGSRAMTQVESCNESPASPLFLQVQDFPNAASEEPGKIVLKLKGSSSASVENGHLSSVVKTTNSSTSANKSRKNKHWGLIWRKEYAEDTGIDFRLKNILHKGNPDNLIKPSCHLCEKQYNADLTYIFCETCQYWFHADALEFDESKLFSLVGFKCCLCRRIKSPECPYMDPETKRVLKDKIERKWRPKMEVLQMHSDSVSISKYHKGDLPVYSVSPKAEVIHAVAEDPLLSEFDKWAKHNSEVNYGLNDATLSVQVPQKLTVRRYVEQEKSADSFQAQISSPFESEFSSLTKKLPVRRHFQIEESKSSEINNLKSEPDSLSPKIQWDNFGDGIILDYDSVGFDDMEFEPQTYFSFNDLLDFNEAGNESSGNVIKDWENSSELQENGSLELLSVQTVIENVACNICSHTEPRPDLLCEVCSKSIHKYCSPWIESSTQDEASWKCGNCREWR